MSPDTCLGRVARAIETMLRILTSLVVIIAVVPILILLNVKADDINILRDYHKHKSLCLGAPAGTLNAVSCRKAGELLCEAQRRQLIGDAAAPPHCQ